MRKEDELVDGCTEIAAILGVSPQNVRVLHAKGLIPTTKFGSSYLGNRTALVECRKRGRYWGQGKRRADAEARFAAEDAALRQAGQVEECV